MDTSDDNRKQVFLVLRAQSGETAAFDELFKGMQSPLYRYILRMVRDSQTAEDTLQDVFLIIYKKIRWLQDPKLFRPWAYRIASRECFKHLKKERQHSFEQAHEDGLDVIAAPEIDLAYDPQMVAGLPLLVSRLSPESRSAIELHYLNDFSLRETAEILNISVGTAKSRVAYGLKLLRKLMDHKKNHK